MSPMLAAREAAPVQQLALDLERLLPALVRSLEDPSRRGYEQFVGQLADLLIAGWLRLASEARAGPGAVAAGSSMDGGQVLRIQMLGRDRVAVGVGGREIVLSRRHSEIVALLAAHPTGMTGEQLALALYGERGKPQTVRAEVSRLRRLLGACIQTDPYRFQAVVRSDIAEVERLLRDGRVNDAAACYRGPLLPGSDAPGVVDLRDELDGWTRRAALAADDADTIWKWVNTPSGQDDIPAWKRLLTIIPHDDGRRALAAARLDRLRPQFAVARSARLSSGTA